VADRTYRVIVEGELSDDLAFAFPEVALTRADGCTALTGTVRDQAELLGLLRRTSDLGLTLLEARAIDDRSRGFPAASQPPNRAAGVPSRATFLHAAGVPSRATFLHVAAASKRRRATHSRGGTNAALDLGARDLPTQKLKMNVDVQERDSVTRSCPIGDVGAHV
jgi:hypothetical protein